MLKKEDKYLVILISLQHHEGSFRPESKYTQAIAVLCISEEGSFRYLPGLVNHLHKDRY